MNHEIEKLLRGKNIVEMCEAHRSRGYAQVYRKEKYDPIKILIKGLQWTKDQEEYQK